MDTYTVERVAPPPHGDAAPLEQDRRVMVLLLGCFGDLVAKGCGGQ